MLVASGLREGGCHLNGTVPARIVFHLVLMHGTGLEEQNRNPGPLRGSCPALSFQLAQDRGLEHGEPVNQKISESASLGWQRNKIPSFQFFCSRVGAFLRSNECLLLNLDAGSYVFTQCPIVLGTSDGCVQLFLAEPYSREFHALHLSF